MQAQGKFRVMIADDEPAARRGLVQQLAAFSDFEVVSTCRNGAEVLAALDTVDPDVIFLDIQMPGLNGFEVINKRSPERMPAIVFLTAYDQFAVDAFAIAALDYLVKPASEARFAASIERLRKYLVLHARSTGEKIVATTPRGSAVLDVADIEWIEASGNYAQLWVGDRSYLLRESLHVLAQRLHKHGFVRAHRQAVMQQNKIKELVRDKRGVLTAILESGIKVRVSRRRTASITAIVKTKAE